MVDVEIFESAGKTRAVSTDYLGSMAKELNARSAANFANGNDVFSASRELWKGRIRCGCESTWFVVTNYAGIRIQKMAGVADGSIVDPSRL